MHTQAPTHWNERTVWVGIIHVHRIDLLIVLNSHTYLGSIPFGCRWGQPLLVAVPVPGLRKYVSFTTPVPCIVHGSGGVHSELKMIISNQG